MAKGFRDAGVVFDVAFDKDSHACASYEANHGHRPIQMDVHDLLRMVREGWRPLRDKGRLLPEESIELLVADPPCTPWSRAGKREGLEDPRDCLKATAELIRLLRPRAYLIGNVPGLQDSTSWGVVQTVIGGLAKHGYCVADHVSLDAADYGVPQHRIRPFWFGHLDGPCVRWPSPTHGAPSEQLAIGGVALRPWVTCRQALEHLSLEDLGRPVRMRIREAGEKAAKDGGDASRCSATDKPASTVVAAPGRKGGQILIPNDKHPPSRPDEPAKTITSHLGATGSAIGGACAAGNGSMMRLPDPNRPPTSPDEVHRSLTTQAATTAVLEWPWDRPDTTVVAKTTMAAPGHHTRSNLSDPNAVILSERAAAILQGFPEDWVFSGDTKKARWSQIGQAMPPGLAEPVARAIVEQMRAARGERAA